MPIRLLVVVCLWGLFELSTVLGQSLGGRYAFPFLRLSPSARITALGGNLITVVDDDVSLALINPALLNNAMHQQLSFNHAFYPAKINQGAFAYAHHATGINTTFQLGVQYVSYGEMPRTNEFFQAEGTFKAGETALVLGAAHQVYDRLQVGANIKFANSTLAEFSAIALAADLGAVYQDTAQNITVSLVLQNMGTALSGYTSNQERLPLPFDMQLGISKRLRYLPLRFSAIYTNLQRWDIRYDDPNAEPTTVFLGEEPPVPSSFDVWLDTFFRHFIFNAELLIGARDNLRIRAGYNHRLRKELSVSGLGSLAGFSFGVGFKVNRFRIDYGRGNFHLAGGINQFSISTNLQEFKR